jgi:hypothetical protein
MIAPGLHSDEASDMALETRWRHDVICNEATELPCIFDNSAHASKAFEGSSVELGGAACHQDLGRWTLPVRTADRLSRLPNRLVGDGAAIDHDPVFAGGRSFSDRLTLGEVEPAAKSDRFDAH